MRLVNNGRKTFSTKAQYEREPLAGCMCSDSKNSALNYKMNTHADYCVCECDWLHKSGNINAAQEGSLRNGVAGSDYDPIRY